MPDKILASYGAKWAGIDVSTTAFDIPREASPFMNNFVMRGGFLFPRWPMKQMNGLANPPDGQPLVAVFSFKEFFGGYHTNLISTHNWYQIGDGGSIGSQYYTYALVGAFPQPLGIIIPPAYITYAQVAYVTSNNQIGVYAWDGTNTPITEVTGGLFGGAYMFELAGSICIASTIEAGNIKYPYRIRWCAAGFPNIWDPNANRGAGFIDILDAPDDIKGVIQLGSVALILRTNGISQFIPTGQGTAPFSVAHLWDSDNGTGELYPSLAASFGSLGFIVSKEDVYSITLSSFTPISGSAKYAIYKDLSNVTNDGVMAGFITHKLSYGSLYPIYQMCLPVPTSPTTTNMVTWSYSISDKSWFRSFYTNKQPCGIPNFVYLPGMF